MTVMHLTNVLRFDEFLSKGGRHLFEITADEVPELQNVQGVHQGIKIACKVSSTSVKKGTWTRIVDQLAARNGSCLYRQVASNTYRVVCTIPQEPGLAENSCAIPP
ncbi:hypothetical protein GCM10010981_18660 [Dyella nitratireducens]|uniref:Uncharacterized protein n=2 Tax=Dyella nitratireducens TaxID=1849580 RepID=A0ABQ1FT56_9GAMM|nr:hypothetical protein GCM10010981_18660 [Dyella nitratireducens]GLQ43070.1 hypothetical protein GCM10007902_29200 [Dyella nitratireducens]